MERITEGYRKLGARLYTIFTNEKGQTAIEYALVAVLIAIVLAYAFSGVQNGISGAASKVNSVLTNP